MGLRVVVFVLVREAVNVADRVAVGVLLAVTDVVGVTLTPGPAVGAVSGR